MTSTPGRRTVALSVNSGTTTVPTMQPAAAYQELTEALLAADEPALQRLVADDCRIIGPKGFHLSKQEWIQAHVSDVYEMKTLENQVGNVATYGEVAVLVVRQESLCIFHGERIDGTFQTLSVWHRAGEPVPWQLVALQYTAISSA